MADSFDLDAIEALLAAATPGPWRHDNTKHWAPGLMGAASKVDTPQEAVFYAGGAICLTGESDDPQSMADARLIAAAPTALRSLLAYARGLEQERDAAQARHDVEIAGIVAAVDHEAFMLPDAGDRLIRLRDSIATTHAAALARHAGRNTGGSNG